MPQTGFFVDLAALRALDGGAQEQTGGSWKTRKNKESARIADTMPLHSKKTMQVAGDKCQGRQILDPNRRPSPNLQPSPSKANEDLSPNDRPIVIGISIPTADVGDRAVSPQTAGSETTRIVQGYECRSSMGRTPDTPTIMITPAQEGSVWSPLDTAGASSDPQHSKDLFTAFDAPPVPNMPAQTHGRRMMILRILEWFHHVLYLKRMRVPYLCELAAPFRSPTTRISTDVQA